MRYTRPKLKFLLSFPLLSVREKGFLLPELFRLLSCLGIGYELGLERLDLGIVPKGFDIVEFACFRLENVDKHVEIVE